VGGAPAVAPPPTPSGSTSATPAGEACPLCGAPLHRTQEWCLQCGAAARTRLAASPNWKGLTATLAVVVALALAVLAAALVKLAGGSESSPPATTTTVASAPSALTPTQTGSATTSSTSGLPASGKGTLPTGKHDLLTPRIEERLRRLGLLGGKGAK
jgi:hypothetical protein